MSKKSITVNVVWKDCNMLSCESWNKFQPYVETNLKHKQYKFEIAFI